MRQPLTVARCVCVHEQLVDVSTPKLSVLLVQGVLVFATDVPVLNMDAEYIFVFGGTFEVGTKEAPFLNKATITLHGEH